MDPLLLSTPFWLFLFRAFFLGALKNRKVRVRQPDPRWKVPESTHYLGKLIIVIIPRSTCHKSKFRKSRKVGREYHPQSHEAEKSLVNILVSFLFCLFFFLVFTQCRVFNNIILITLYAILNFTFFPTYHFNIRIFLMILHLHADIFNDCISWWFYHANVPEFI